MGCGCIKVSATTDVQKKKSIALALKMAEIEGKTYVIYENENEEYIDSLAGWERDGRPGELRTIIEC